MQETYSAIDELKKYHPEYLYRHSFENALMYCFRGEYAQAATQLEAIAGDYPRVVLFLDWIHKQHPGVVKTGLKYKELIERDLIASARGGDLNSLYDYGLYCFLSERDSEAVAWFKQGAKQGNADAQFHLGLCYIKGKEVSHNLPEAAKCFHQAAGQGHSQAASYLALCCLDDDSIAQTYAPWFQEAQRHQDASVREIAIFHLGFCHFTGKGGSKPDYRQAAKYFYKLWATGNRQSQYYFAMCCALDQHVPEDYESLCKLLNYSSIKHGDQSRFLIGKFLQMAAGRGHPIAKDLLNDLKSEPSLFGSKVNQLTEGLRLKSDYTRSHFSQVFKVVRIEAYIPASSKLAPIPENTSVKKETKKTNYAEDEYLLGKRAEDAKAYDYGKRKGKNLQNALEHYETAEKHGHPLAEGARKRVQNKIQQLQNKKTANWKKKPVEITQSQKVKEENHSATLEALLPSEIQTEVNPRSIITAQAEVVTPKVSQSKTTKSERTTTSKPSKAQTLPKMTLQFDTPEKPALSFPPSLDEEFEKAMYAHDKSHYKKALTYLFKLAAAGYPPAYLYLGLMHATGEGVPRNLKRAEEYYDKIRPKEQMAWFFGSNRDYLIGLYWQCVIKNNEWAVATYKTALKNNALGKLMQDRALYRMGDAYIGLGKISMAEQNFEDGAAKNYGLALEQVGAFAIGRYQIESNGYEIFNPQCRYYKKAILNLKKAVDQEQASAAFQLGKFFFEIEYYKKAPLQKNFDEAIKYLTLALQWDEDSQVQYYLGLCFDAKEAYEKAENMFKLAADKGDKDSVAALKKVRDKMGKQKEVESETVKEVKESKSSVRQEEAYALKAWGKDLFPGEVGVHEDERRLESSKVSDGTGLVSNF